LCLWAEQAEDAGEDKAALEATVEVEDDNKDDKRTVVSEEVVKVAQGIEAKDACVRHALVNPVPHLSLCTFAALKMQALFSLSFDPWLSSCTSVCCQIQLSLSTRLLPVDGKSSGAISIGTCVQAKNVAAALHGLLSERVLSRLGWQSQVHICKWHLARNLQETFCSCAEHGKEANEQRDASLMNLKEILKEAETESAECTTERLTQLAKDGGVGGAGKIA
jgi:hypothetical protein